MQLKQQVYDRCQQLLDAKIAEIEQVLKDLRESGANETKSTAGDKHETALAMLQIEQANKRAQLDELFSQKAVLNSINPSIAAAQVLKGSLVKTPHAYFFVSVALGKVNVEGQNIIALSAQSALGLKLMGMQKGEELTFMHTHYKIEEIL